MITEPLFDKKIDNLQHQLDIMHREDVAFKGYVNRQFEFISREMVTKEDLRTMEVRMRAEMVTKDDLSKLTEIVVKIAEKVGVSA